MSPGTESRPVTEARRRVLTSLGLNPDNLSVCRQIHSRRVVRAFEALDGAFPEADGLVGSGADILSVTVADCLPIYLIDTKTGAFAICHSGRKGTGIAVRAVELMREIYACAPENIYAFLGPCIRGGCYEVDEDCASGFEAEFASLHDETLGPAVIRAVGQKPRIDLQAANLALLRRAGLPAPAYSSECTHCNEALGSFRREGRDFTKMLALIYSEYAFKKMV